MAHRIRDVVRIAEERRAAPEVIADNQQEFGSYWLKERELLEDVCRIMQKPPNLFITIAPYEGKT
eukprot:10023843-Karenia_brevis.AAC.1